MEESVNPHYPCKSKTTKEAGVIVIPSARVPTQVTSEVVENDFPSLKDLRIENSDTPSSGDCSADGWSDRNDTNNYTCVSDTSRSVVAILLFL